MAEMSRVSDPWIAEVIGMTGYDVIWFDMEHRVWLWSDRPNLAGVPRHRHRPDDKNSQGALHHAHGRSRIWRQRNHGAACA